MPFHSKFSFKLRELLKGKKRMHPVEQLLQKWLKENPQWISITANKKAFEESLYTREVEVLTRKEATLLRLSFLPENNFWSQIWVNQNSLGGFKEKQNDRDLALFNEFIDLVIEKKLYNYQQKLNVLDNKTFTSTEIATEEKGLEWLKVSFMMLGKAVIQSLGDPELLFQTSLFLGNNPRSGLDEIRVITFNLDIKFEFLPNHLLRVRIYNDKNEEFGSSKKAALEGDFNYRKREMLDELTTLLSTISTGIKI